jgi:hypothetical protein
MSEHEALAIAGAWVDGALSPQSPSRGTRLERVADRSAGRVVIDACTSATRASMSTVRVRIYPYRPCSSLAGSKNPPAGRACACQ